VNAVINELASVHTRMSATLHPLTSITDMTSLDEIQNTFPPYDSTDGILYTNKGLCAYQQAQLAMN